MFPKSTLVRKQAHVRRFRPIFADAALCKYHDRGWRVIRSGYDPRKREDGRMDEELDYPRSIGDRYTLKVQLYKDVLGGKLSDKDFFIMV